MAEFGKVSPEKAQAIISALKDGQINAKEMKELGLTAEVAKQLNEAFSLGDVQIGDFVLVNKGKVTKNGKTYQLSVTKDAPKEEPDFFDKIIDSAQGFVKDKRNEIRKYTNVNEAIRNQAQIKEQAEQWLANHKNDKPEKMIEYVTKQRDDATAMENKLKKMKELVSQGKKSEAAVIAGQYYFSNMGFNDPLHPKPQEAGMGRTIKTVATALGAAGAVALLLASCSKGDDYQYYDMSSHQEVNNTTNIDISQKINDVHDTSALEALIKTYGKEFIAAIKENSALMNTLINNLGGDTAAILEVLNKILGKTEGFEELLKAILLNQGIQQNTLNAIKGNTDDIKGLLTQISKAINNLGDEVKADFQALLDAAVRNGQKLDDLKALLALINANVEKNGEEAKQTGREIIAAIKALGVENSAGFAAVLAAINKGDKAAQAMLEKLLDAVKENTAVSKEILKAIGNLGGSAIGSLNAILKAIGDNNTKLDALKKLLQTINTNVVNNGKITQEMGEKILEAISKLGSNMVANFNAVLSKMDRNPNYMPILEKILAKLGDIDNTNKTNYAAILTAIAGRNDIDLTKLMNKLDEILEAIKHHEVHVTVDAECHCHCEKDGSPNEGIITEINNILG